LFGFAMLLMVPYFAWGVYTLRVRFKMQAELAPKVESATLIAVAIFLSFEMYAMGSFFLNERIAHIFSVLGLILSAVALYGPMAVSLTTHFLTDMVHPSEIDEPNVPQFSAAEAREEVGDYEGAVEEYLIISRIFPKDQSTALRLADALTQLDRYQDAAEWFERGLALIEDPERAVLVANRLVEIYLNRLEKPAEAARVLRNYIEQHPDSDRIDSTRERLDRLLDEHPQLPKDITAQAQAPQEDPSE